MHSGPVLIYCRSASIFFDLDNEIKRTDFLENIFDCYKTKEKQSFVPINFNINAFVGKKSVLERHSVCGKADEKLYDMIYEEFCRRFDMLVKVLTDRVSNEEEYAFLYYLAICSRGYE